MLHTSHERADRVSHVVARVAHRLQSSPSSRDIRAWAAESGLDGPDDWPLVKVELRRQLGIDYDHVAGLQVAMDALRLAEAACRRGPDENTTVRSNEW